AVPASGWRDDLLLRCHGLLVSPLRFLPGALPPLMVLPVPPTINSLLMHFRAYLVLAHLTPAASLAVYPLLSHHLLKLRKFPNRTLSSNKVLFNCFHQIRDKSMSKANVLLVSSDDLLRWLVQSTLVGEGYKIDVTRNGVDGLTLALLKPLNLFLVDQNIAD